MTRPDAHTSPNKVADEGQRIVPAPDSQRLLHLYLRDHDAASAGGLRLLQRTCASNAGTPFAPVLEELRAQVQADAASLQQIAARLDVRRDPVKRAVALIGATLGGLKPNARMVRYSPLSRVYEFEGLTAGVRAKRDLWQSLQLAAQVDERIDSGELDGLMKRADEQLRTLDDIRERAATLAFGGAN